MSIRIEVPMLPPPELNPECPGILGRETQGGQRLPEGGLGDCLQR